MIFTMLHINPALVDDFALECKTCEPIPSYSDNLHFIHSATTALQATSTMYLLYSDNLLFIHAAGFEASDTISHCLYNVSGCIKSIFLK